MNHHSIVDLHLHSTASDGMLDPAALVAHVAACGVRLMALTDHDTVAGVGAAAAAARDHGIGFVPGVELSVTWRGRELHVLGLAIDPEAPVLMRGLASQQALRETRALSIAERLQKAGAPGNEAMAAIRAAGSLPTRTHFARALVALGAATDIQGAFDRWLGRGRPGHGRRVMVVVTTRRRQSSASESTMIRMSSMVVSGLTMQIRSTVSPAHVVDVTNDRPSANSWSLHARYRSGDQPRRRNSTTESSGSMISSVCGAAAISDAAARVTSRVVSTARV